MSLTVTLSRLITDMSQETVTRSPQSLPAVPVADRFFGMGRQEAAVRWAKRARQRKTARVAGLRLAPGDLETLQAFVNTTARDKKADQFASPPLLKRWLEHHGLLDADATIGEPERRRALEVRRDLRTLILAKSGVQVDDEVLLRLEQATEDGRLVVRFNAGGPDGFSPAAGRLDDALMLFLGIVAAARLDGTWQHFKLCARDECGRAFFDASVNRTGTWCSPQCGDRVRSAARRRRRNEPLV